MIKINFETLSRYNRKKEPCIVSVPFKEGELLESGYSRITLTDGEKDYPAQFKTTSKWKDGSVKWLLVNFLADLPGNAPKDFYLDTDRSPKSEVKESVSLIKTEEGLTIHTGVLKAEMAPAGSIGMFRRISLDGNTYEADEIQGPFLINDKDETFLLEVGEKGWEIIESGPVRSIIRTEGRHRSANESTWLDYSLMVYAYAGKPWLKFDYQFINREESKREVIKGIELMIKPGYSDKKTIVHKIATSNYKSTVQKGDSDDRLSFMVDADYILGVLNEQFPEVLWGVFMADWKSDRKAISASIYQAHQNFPKAFETDREGITMKLMPPEHDSLTVPQGVARTSRFYLHFHSPELPQEELIARAFQFQMPDIPRLEAKLYQSTKVFDDVITENYHVKTERFLYRYLDGRSKGLGMLHFGDAPEWEYTKQGRGAGKDIWINNEYDMPHSFMLMFARTGDRRYYDYMRAGVEHWFDVDVVHYSPDPLRNGTQVTHSVNHVTGKSVPSHQWVEGLLDYYHVTGNVIAYETAFIIGESLLRLLQQPEYSKEANLAPREAGWALRSLVALYNETHDQKWLQPIQPIVDYYIGWAEHYGSWIYPYTDHCLARIPFMITVGISSLMRYYRVDPQPGIKNVIIKVVDDLIKNSFIERIGLFYGKQLPSIRFINLNGMVLEALEVAYELTGDIKYLEKGLGTFEFITCENQPQLFDFTKIKRDSHTVIYDCSGPKRFAQSFLPFMMYYRAILNAGLLK